MEREIPSHHEDTMRQMCALKDNDPLPKKLVASYWSIRWPLDRVGQGNAMSYDKLADLCVGAGYGKPTAIEAAGPSVVQMFRMGQIKAGDPVVVNYRDEEVEGVLQFVRADNQCGVIINGDEKLVQPDTLSLPKAVATA